jgi:hypothetical protein
LTGIYELQAAWIEEWRGVVSNLSEADARPDQRQQEERAGQPELALEAVCGSLRHIGLARVMPKHAAASEGVWRVLLGESNFLGKSDLV